MKTNVKKTQLCFLPIFLFLIKYYVLSMQGEETQRSFYLFQKASLWVNVMILLFIVQICCLIQNGKVCWIAQGKYYLDQSILVAQILYNYVNSDANSFVEVFHVILSLLSVLLININSTLNYGKVLCYYINGMVCVYFSLNISPTTGPI